MRATYAYDRAAIARWFEDRALALPPWPLDGLAALAFERRGRVAAFALYAWAEAEVMQLHVACDARDRGAWTRGALGDLHRFPQLLGAGTLISHASVPEGGRALRALGWSETAPGLFQTTLPNQWSRYELRHRHFHQHFSRP